MKSNLLKLIIICILFINCSVYDSLFRPGKVFSEKLDTWIGNNVDDLVTSWGPPSNTFVLNNGDVLYTWCRY